MGKLTTIGESAFFNCGALTSVGEIKSIINIGDFAFYDCISLESIGALHSVTEIGNAAFYNCPSLTLRVLPDSYAENYAKSNKIPYTYIED